MNDRPDFTPADDEYAPHQKMYVSLVDGPALDVLRAQVATIAVLPQSITHDKASFRYAEKKWSVRQVIGHMADAERVYQYRALVLARGGDAALQRWDPDGYAEAAGFEERSIADLAAELLAVRHATIPLFAHMPHEAWSRRGELNGKPLTVRALAFIAAGHFQRHLNVLRERYGID